MPYLYRCDVCNDEQDIWGAFEMNKEASCEGCGQACCKEFCLKYGLCPDCQRELDKQDEDKDNG